MKNLKHLRVDDVKKREVQEAGPDAPTESLMSAGLKREAGVPDVEYCVHYATAAEWKTLRDVVEKRKVKEPLFSWWLCAKCGRGYKSDFGQVARNAAKPLACLYCNPNRYKDGGFYRRMTAAEAQRFEDNEKKAAAEFALRAEKQAFHRRNVSRAEAGLDPMTLPEFLADRKAEWLQARAEDRKLAELDASHRREKALDQDRKDAEAAADRRRESAQARR